MNQLVTAINTQQQCEACLWFISFSISVQLFQGPSGSYCQITSNFTVVACAACTVCGLGYQTKYSCQTNADTVCVVSRSIHSKKNRFNSAQDINECALGTSSCSSHAVCTNLAGSYSCSGCNAGYHGDGHVCLPCSVCASGYNATSACTTTQDTICTPLNQCLGNPCALNATCIPSLGSYSLLRVDFDFLCYFLFCLFVSSTLLTMF